MGKAAQGFAARRTLCTPQPETCYDRRPSGKKAIYGRKLVRLATAIVIEALNQKGSPIIFEVHENFS